MRKLLLTGLLVIGALSGFVKGGTYAMYTSTPTSANNTFTSGTVTIGAGLTVPNTLTMTNLVPGDSFVAQLDVKNNGTLPLYDALTTSTTGSASLASTLQLTIRTKTTNPCSSLDGTVLSSAGALSSAAFGSSAQGFHAGDRSVASGGTDSLCFAVSFPAGSASALAGTTTTATFNFNAQQQ
jgi:predicted ribosomally synthesized peptide with SipW-like signal peptide